MNKVWLIIKREYITRVRNKTFLLSTFLLPVVMVVFIAGSVYFTVKGRQELKLAVVNDPGFYQQNIKTDSSKSVRLSFEKGVDSLNYEKKGFDGVLYIPADSSTNFIVHSKKQLGLEANGYLERKLNKAVEAHLLLEKGIQKSVLDSISKVSEKAVKLTNIVNEENGKSKTANAGKAYAIGFGSGILIYITMFIFGAMVMRGVMEEKTNRIAEVIISSVKPFQLMIGKIIGIAGVGLTQFILWIILIIGIGLAAANFLTPDTMQDVQNVSAQNPGMAQNAALAQQSGALDAILGDTNWPLIIGCFLFYFLGGYLFYSALFAAVGSVINEDPQEAQSLMLPITMPIIFSFIILSSGLQDTNSPMMFWASMIPFSSPIIMMGRLPSGVPWYELASSMLLLVLGFMFTTWLAGKIYRTGILMYGKKASWKEMLKWAFKKG
ncbi:MAG: ABC transporter permease [Chitinophagaceae bacterium]|uniref:ABC transporter permease n=1 Tax=unclassified Paraflavitalea TaxID=2798305 RepID=UPI003D341F0C|nr:ABC transporter permease [Chitinophagaceae bacterium]